MNREEAKAELKTREPDFLTQAKKRVNGANSYICPSCGNGSGNDGTGIALDPKSKGGKRYKCFVCGLREDVIGLWKLAHNETDDKEAFNQLYNYYGITIDDTPFKSTKTSPKEAQKLPTKEKINNYISYYGLCCNRVSQTDYFKKRGLSDSTIERFKLGFDPNYTRGTGGKSWEAVIIPLTSSIYIARNTDEKAVKKNRYRKTGANILYATTDEKQTEKPLFITEGELDAISIVEAGGEAIGLGSTANHKQLIELLKKNKPKKPIILALDNDEDGKATTEKLIEELELAKILYLKADIYGEHKDANEALTADRTAFIEAVKEADREAISYLEELERAEREEYLNNSTANHLQGFINGIADSVNTPYIPTGFKKLDGVLEGGLYEGLYFIGGISSLGKTTLAQQITDQIAEAGGDVLIFSLEMSRTELISKTVSRLTLLDIIQNNGNTRDAKTARGITTGTRYFNYSPTEKALINRAVTTYSQFAEHIFIHEGIGDIGVDAVRAEVAKHIKYTGKKPVVLIDYVQILAPAEIRATDKQNIDKAVLELKRISRDFKIPVIGISSFNRAGYKDAVTMEAFKESGAIEYSSDILIGLQLKGVGSSNFNVDEAKRKNPREIELVILKNRNGKTVEKVSFEYYPLFNYFREFTEE